MTGSTSERGKHRWVYSLIYGGDMARRFTQDSPVLPDVWEAFASPKDEVVDLLLTPYQDPQTGGTSAGDLCSELLKRLGSIDRDDTAGAGPRDRETAYNQSNVAVKLSFSELVRIVLPMSRWWHDRCCKVDDGGREVVAPKQKGGPKKGAPKGSVKEVPKDDVLSRLIRGEGVEEIVEALFDPDKKVRNVGARDAKEPAIRSEVLWMVRVIGTIALVNQGREPAELLEVPEDLKGKDGETRRALFREIVAAAAQLLKGVPPHRKQSAHVYAVSRNREALSSIYRSAVSVKADAVARLFDVDCSTITWAVIDAGIDAEHSAFRRFRKPAGDTEATSNARSVGKNGRRRAAEEAQHGPREVYYEKPFEVDDELGVMNRTRILATYDFTMIRTLLRVTPSGQELERIPDALKKRMGIVDKAAGAKTTKGAKVKPPSPALKEERDALERNLMDLKESLRRGREIDWELVKTLIEVPHREGDYERPKLDHGTHVAGILAADWREGCSTKTEDAPPREGGIYGICPDMKLYDLRVFGDNSAPESAEFNIMSALQFVCNLNAHKKFMVVHGVNLSLSLRHEVENYACGRTPICDECERLVNSGLVVVAAAGNNGYQRRGQESSLDDRYQSMTITDPGNADAVITVGATHRDMPHTYGVSYFSSRGPTGDGRPKPDLVAPGEKIDSTIPNGLMASKDGTSMAAPHVSGAAALIMARNAELIGRPVRIKEILCASATDLGRDRYFQGSGMLDILRALQSV